MGRTRGFSLAEMLITCMLATLLFAMTSRFLVTSFTLSTQGAVQAAAQSEAVIAMQKMLADLQRSCSSALFISPSQQAFGLVHMTTLTSLRTLVWDQNMVVYWLDPESNKLYTEVYPPAPPELGLLFDVAQPPHVTPEQMQEIVASPNERAHSLASGVDEMTLKPVEDYLELTLRMSVQVNDRASLFELKRVVSMRNHL